MNYDEFITKIKKLGYKCDTHLSCGIRFFCWRYPIYDGELDEVLISYVIDESGKVRQQFSSAGDIVGLLIKPNGYAGGKVEMTYEKCFNKLMVSKYGKIDAIRDIKLESII